MIFTELILEMYQYRTVDIINVLDFQQDLANTNEL